MERRTVLTTIAALALLGLTGCGKPEFPDYRYRLTVEVDTPQGLRTGSSVIEVHSVREHGSMERLLTPAKGEAVAVDLPGGKVLVALLTGENGSWAAAGGLRDAYPPIAYGLADYQAHPDPFGAFVKEYQRMTRNRGVMVVPRTKLQGGGGRYEAISNYPRLVTFANIADPKSVVAVDADNLAASFGAGTKLRRITAQLTDDPVTVGIEKWLRWLATVGRQRGTLLTDTPRLVKDASPVQLVAPSDFSTELYK